MIFSSLIFIFAFLPGLLVLYYAVFHTRKQRNVLLTLASLFFYAWGEPKFVLIMMLSILCNWVFGLLVTEEWFAEAKGKKLKRTVLIAALVANLSLLGYYKYLNFLIRNANMLLGESTFFFSYKKVALPIGISFFTFQSMSYVIDVYRGRCESQKNPLNVALYIALFPQLIAGPIVRYETIARQIENRKESLKLFSEGVRRFVEGMAKKVLLANSLAIVADNVFQTADYTSLTVGFAWLGALCYSLQIYFDFSGYSDMALGLGKMFGFIFPENFNYPYISQSISEFWRRWHISLGTWFKDYVYFPLGGSRVDSKVRLMANLFVVWLLTGIWHGASWNFVVWGLLYFVFISFEKLTNIPGRFQPKFARMLYCMVTLLVVIIAWVLFRAPGLRKAVEYIFAMIGIHGNALYDPTVILYLRENFVIIFFVVILSTPIIAVASKQIRRITRDNTVVFLTGSIGYYLCLLLLFLSSVSFLVKGSYNPFIYFNF